MQAVPAVQARPQPNGWRRVRLTATVALAALGVLFGQPAAAQQPPGQPLPAVTELVSSSSAELPGNDDSSDPSVDASAFLIAFESRADKLVPNDTNDPTPGQIGGGKDVFVRNRGTGTTSRVSISSTQGQANDESEDASISADGLRVAFTSFADNLVSNDTNDASDVFVRDRATGTTIRVSVSSIGGQATGGNSGDPSISADGRWVAFTSSASNLTAGDTNGVKDVFVHNVPGGFTRRVSLSSAEANGNQPSTSASISGDGRYVAFQSEADNLVPGDTNDPTPGQIGGGRDVFVRDQQAGTTTRVSVRSNGAQATGGDSFSPEISADGRWVAFSSRATNLLADDVNGTYEDVFLHDRVGGATRLVGRSTTGQQASSGSGSPAISADGRWVAFHSRAGNLVPGDTNNDFDVFRYDRVTQSTGRFSLTTSGGQTGLGGSNSSPAISADGSKIAFVSDATNMGPANNLITYDVFLRRPDPEVAA